MKPGWVGRVAKAADKLSNGLKQWSSLRRQAAETKNFRIGWAIDWQLEMDHTQGLAQDEYDQEVEHLMGLARRMSFNTNASPDARPVQMSQEQWMDLALERAWELASQEPERTQDLPQEQNPTPAAWTGADELIDEESQGESRLYAMCLAAGLEFRPDGWPTTRRTPRSTVPSNPAVGTQWMEYDVHRAVYVYCWDGVSWVCISETTTRASLDNRRAQNGDRYTTEVQIAGPLSVVIERIAAVRAGRGDPGADLSTTAVQLLWSVTREEFDRYVRDTNYSRYRSYTFFGVTALGPELCALLTYIQYFYGDAPLQLIAALPHRRLRAEWDGLSQIHLLSIESSSSTRLGELRNALGEPREEATAPPEGTTESSNYEENTRQSTRRLQLSHKERKAENVTHQLYQGNTDPVNRGITKRRKRTQRKGD